MNIDRPCRLGGCVGCPGEMHVSQGDGYLGEIREDFDPYCSRYDLIILYYILLLLSMMIVLLYKYSLIIRVLPTYQ